MTTPRLLFYVAAAAALAGCGGGGGGGTPIYTGPGTSAPRADAGPDQAVDEQTEVVLDGSASSDPDGPIVSFSWTQIEGTPVTLQSRTSATTRFTAPAVSVPVTLIFELFIVDTDPSEGSDRVNVTVNPVAGLNFAPTADAGLSRTLSELGNVQLDGSASSDADGFIASYAWRQLGGPQVVLSDATAARPFFQAPPVSAPTTLTFELRATDNEGASHTDQVTITVVPAGVVTLSGTVRFHRVPAVSPCFQAAACLDYGGTMELPARGITVEVVDAANGVSVLASGRTDAVGAFSVNVQNFSDVFLRARAEMIASGTPAWDVRVVDNTRNDALYVIDGPAFNTGGSNQTSNLVAYSGWTGSDYGLPRSAAPLAILDTIYDAIALVLTADPAAQFPALTVYWSSENRPVSGADGGPDPDTGEIGTSFYRSGPDGGIFLLGSQNDDTEEYDEHVIAHEWGHYFEDTFSRSDSIGGPHTLGDQLDMRVAFGEGWGNAVSAMATGDSVYKDTLGPQQGAGFDINIENERRLNPGWYSEGSVQEILYDIFDSNPDVQPGTSVQDLVSLGFAPIYDVLVTTQRTTTALTSLFPFIEAIKANEPASAAAIDALLGVHQIEPIDDAYAASEDNAGNPASADVLPIYADITVNGGSVNVCSTDEFSGSLTGSVNKLGSRRYLRFRPVVSATHTISATTTSAPSGTSTDPDMWLHSAGPLWPPSNGSPSAACTPTALAQCVEQFSRSLTAGREYVLEVYEWTNTNDSDELDFPPIGRACFDVTVTQP